MEFSTNEMSLIILHLCMGYPGKMWKEEIYKYPVVVKFIEKGYASLDDTYEERYVVNELGKIQIQSFVASVFDDFVIFMKEKRYECSQEDAFLWCEKKCEIKGEIEKGILFDFIWSSFSEEKYKKHKQHRHRKGFWYVLEERG